MIHHPSGALAALVAANTGLKVLSLSSNALGDKGGLALAAALKTNTTLE